MHVQLQLEMGQNQSREDCLSALLYMSLHCIAIQKISSPLKGSPKDHFPVLSEIYPSFCTKVRLGLTH